jgi:hypothetical protein
MPKKKASGKDKPGKGEWLPCGCRKEGKKLVRVCPEHQEKQ